MSQRMINVRGMGEREVCGNLSITTGPNGQVTVQYYDEILSMIPMIMK